MYFFVVIADTISSLTMEDEDEEKIQQSHKFSVTRGNYLHGLYLYIIVMELLFVVNLFSK